MQNPPSASPASHLWRWLRRLLIFTVAVVTLVALFYAEEDWRGKRAWEKFKQVMAAKGESLDWAAYVPPPVPDEQNIFKAPKMTEWFVGRGANELTRLLNYETLHNDSAKKLATSGGRVLLAELTVAPPGAPNGGGAVLDVRGPDAKAEAERIVREAIGPTAVGGAGFIFTGIDLNEIKPVRVLLPTDQTPTAAELEQLFPHAPIPPSPIDTKATGTGLQVEATGNDSYRVWLGPPGYYTAAEYLAWSDQVQPEFDVIREALKRPDSRMDGDYESILTVPVPNFVTVRLAAQVLSQRAQCHLALGQPDKALDDLTLLRGLSAILEPRPAGKPQLLVSAMINVAISGLYQTAIADGLRLRAWREPQLAALTEQLAQIKLLPQVRASLRCDRTQADHALLTTTVEAYEKYEKSFYGDDWQSKKYQDPTYLYLRFAPHGWMYQNMIVRDQLFQPLIDSYDSAGEVISPQVIADASGQREEVLAHRTPYNFLAANATPSFHRALQSTARSQTMINEALIACALERFRLANGQFPETLAVLAPQLLKAIPRNLVNGGPLKYRRTEDERFVLYSIGWTQKDDGEAIVMSKDNPSAPDAASGDWVWPTGP